MTAHTTLIEAELDALRALLDEGNIDRRLYERMRREIEAMQMGEKRQTPLENYRKFVAFEKKL